MIKFYPLVVIVTLLFPVGLIAQQKISAKPVSTQSAPSLSPVFKKYALFEIDAAAVDQSIKKVAQGTIQLELDLPGFASFPISMQQHDILANNYKLVVGTPQGGQEFSKPACMTYQGTLTNQGNSSVYLTITNDFIYGMLTGSTSSFFIEPLQYFDKQAKENIYVVYDVKDVLPRTDISCGVSEIQTRHITDNTTARVEGTATGTCKMVEVAIASDDSMTFRYGTAAKVQQHNIAVLNTMVGFYSNAQFSPAQYLEFRIVGQYISTAQANNALSPVTTNADAGVLLDNFRIWGNAGNFGFTYDLGVYWTTKNIFYSGNYAVIGLASTGAACTSFRYQILEDLAGISAAQLGGLATHETGHNFGASHDASGAPYIMAPAIGNPPATTFSPASITDINSYLGSSIANCFSACNAIMPVAQFNASVPNICTGNSITFTDYSVAQVTGVSWTFQDGTPATSTNRSQAVTFSTPGYKNVTLTATNVNGTNSITKTVFVANALTGTGCRTSIAGNSDYGALVSFNLQDINNRAIPIWLGGKYTDFTCAKTTLLQPGTTYYVNAEVGYYQASSPPPALPDYDIKDKFQLFIDYNNDGDFLDANEAVYTSPSFGQGGFNFTFTTPAAITAMDAYLRMRIVSIANGLAVSNGCAIPNNSNIEDYAVYFSSSATLPLLLTSFDGHYSNGKNELNWQTETEVNTDHFIVERSSDGSHFTEVGNVPAKGLTNTLTNYYQLTDALLNAQNDNRFFYRLKIVDNDEAFKYSKLVITTRPNGNKVQVTVYPNPVLRNTTLQIKKATNDRSVIEIFNSMGQKVYAKRLTASLYNTSLEIPGNWGAGIYIVRITDNKESWTGSVMIK